MYGTDMYEIKGVGKPTKFIMILLPEHVALLHHPTVGATKNWTIINQFGKL